MAGTLCNFATQLKFLFGYDDCLDVRSDALFLATMGNANAAFVDIRIAYNWRYRRKRTWYFELIS